MAELSYDEADVRLVEGRTLSGLTMASGGITVAGQLTYQLPTREIDVASNASAGSANVFGVALNSAAPHQPVTLALPGSRIYYGEGVELGVIYCCGEGGPIIPAEDLGDGMYVTVIGVGQDDGILLFSPIASAVAIIEAPPP